MHTLQLTSCSPQLLSAQQAYCRLIPASKSGPSSQLTPSSIPAQPPLSHPRSRSRSGGGESAPAHPCLPPSSSQRESAHPFLLGSASSLLAYPTSLAAHFCSQPAHPCFCSSSSSVGQRTPCPASSGLAQPASALLSSASIAAQSGFATSWPAHPCFRHFPSRLSGSS